MKNPVRLTVAVCLALLSPQSVDANHHGVGTIVFVENGLHIGGGADYSLISLTINAPAPEGLSFNTGVATWLNQLGASFVDTASQQGVTSIDENEPITLPILPPDDIPHGFYLGDLLPHVFKNDLSFWFFSDFSGYLSSSRWMSENVGHERTYETLPSVVRS